MRYLASETDDTITITVPFIAKETTLAVCISAPDDTLIWLPKSQIEIQRRLDSEEVDITIPLWLAEEKELEKYGF